MEFPNTYVLTRHIPAHLSTAFQFKCNHQMFLRLIRGQILDIILRKHKSGRVLIHSLYDHEEILGFANVLILIDKDSMATALTAYVGDGPNVQYDAQARRGPMARPS